MGAAMFVGGIGRDHQEFRAPAATAQASMLFLAGAALVMPAIFELVEGKGLPQPSAEIVDYGSSVEGLSVAVALVLIVTYCGGLLFSLRTHKDMFNPPDEDEETLRLERPTVRADARDRRSRRRRDVGDPRRLDLRGVGVDRALGVLHRRDRRRDRRQRRRALGRGAGRAQGQDGPRGQHRDRLERPDRALRRSGPGARLVLDRPAPAAAGLQRLRARWGAVRDPGRQRRDPRRASRPGSRACSCSRSICDPRRSRSSSRAPRMRSRALDRRGDRLSARQLRRHPGRRIGVHQRRRVGRGTGSGSARARPEACSPRSAPRCRRR